MIFTGRYRETAEGKTIDPPKGLYVILKRRQLDQPDLYEYIILEVMQLVLVIFWTVGILLLTFYWSQYYNLPFNGVLALILVAIVPAVIRGLEYLREGRKFAEVIVTTWDARGSVLGSKGCFRARLQSKHSIHTAGITREEALEKFLIKAKELGYSGKKKDYTVWWL